MSPLENLCTWVDRTNKAIAENQFELVIKAEVLNLRKLIGIVAEDVCYTHPEYGAQLKTIELGLFYLPSVLGYKMNSFLFGQLFFYCASIEKASTELFLE